VSRFQQAEVYYPEAADWQLLPFRFERLNGRVLLTNLVGEHLFVSADDFAELAEERLPDDSPLVKKLRAKHIIRLEEEQSRCSSWPSRPNPL